MKRRGRLVEDRPRQRVDVVAAVVAVVGRASLDAVELALAVALRAMRVRSVGRETLAPEEVKARGIVRVLGHQLHQRVRRFGRPAPRWVGGVRHCASPCLAGGSSGQVPQERRIRQLPPSTQMKAPTRPTTLRRPQRQPNEQAAELNQPAMQRFLRRDSWQHHPRILPPVKG
jgi:hypothetical protein